MAMPQLVPNTQTETLTDHEHGTSDVLVRDGELRLYGDAFAMTDSAHGGNDVLGRGFDRFPADLREAIVAKYPRRHFRDAFLREYFAGFAHKPHTTYGTVNAGICERFIAGSPFPDS